jgi:hypothetical protein
MGTYSFNLGPCYGLCAFKIFSIIATTCESFYETYYNLLASSSTWSIIYLQIDLYYVICQIIIPLKLGLYCVVTSDSQWAIISHKHCMFFSEGCFGIARDMSNEESFGILEYDFCFILKVTYEIAVNTITNPCFHDSFT